MPPEKVSPPRAPNRSTKRAPFFSARSRHRFAEIFQWRRRDQDNFTKRIANLGVEPVQKILITFDEKREALVETGGRLLCFVLLLGPSLIH
jgi:hypothetical protein